MSEESAFQQGKLWLVEHLGLAKDALHIHVGLAVFLGAMLLFRRRPGDWLPLLLAIAAAFGGEAIDIYERLGGGTAPDWRGHAKDVVNTILWPLILTLAARVHRSRIR